MFFKFEQHPQSVGPIVPTRVLNKQDCGVAEVFVSWTGGIAYRECFKLSSHKDIAKVVVRNSSHDKGKIYRWAVDAEMAIYLNDGRVVEVHTDDRRLIQAALKYAPKKSTQASCRRKRGI